MKDSDATSGNVPAADTIKALQRENETLSHQVKRLIKAEGQLYEYQQDLDAQLKEYKELYELNRRLNGTFNIENIFQETVSYAVQQLEFERALLLRKEETGRYLVWTLEGYYDPAEKSLVAGLALEQDDPCLLQLTAQGRECLVCEADSREKELVELRRKLHLDEFFVYPLRYYALPDALLVVGNSAENAGFYRRVDTCRGSMLSLGNLVGLVSSLIENRCSFEKMEKARQKELFAEAKYRSIFENAAEGIFQSTPEGKYLDANPALAHMLGYGSAQELIAEVADQEHQVYLEPQQYAELMRLLDEHGVVEGFEIRMHRKDQSVIWVSLTERMVRNGAGRVLFYEGMAVDITERKRAEEALREAAVKYRIIADNTYNWEFWLTPQGRFIYSSPSCRRITGHGSEEFLANPDLMLSMIHPDDLPLWTSHRHEITQSKALSEIELRIIRPVGDVRWIHHVCSPVFNGDAGFPGIRGSVEDITKRKQAEEKNLRLAAIVESSDDAIVGKTEDGIITSWNRGAEKIFGYNENEVLGKPATILVPPERKDEMLRAHDRIRRGEHIEHFETVSRRKSGELIDMSLTYSPIKDAQGRVVAISTTGRDITAQKKASAALLENVRIKRELELHEKELLLLRQNRLAAMGEMIGNIAHQWRQPLNMLGLFAQELSMTYKKGNFSQEYLDDSVGKMMKTINHMSKTIDDFRDFSRPDKENVNFKILEVIEKTISFIEGSLNAEQVKISVVPVCDPVVNGSPNQFSQALLNIMINSRDAFVAQKATSPKITIEIDTEDNRCVVTITDNAGGIPEEIIDKIFDPYFTTKGPEQGTGVGLYMSKTIIEKNLGGTLSARNVDGGAQFRIVI